MAGTVLFDGEAAQRLSPGVEVYNAAGKLLFYSHLEIRSVTVNGQEALVGFRCIAVRTESYRFEVTIRPI